MKTKGTLAFYMNNKDSSLTTFWLLQTIGWSPVFVLMLLLFGDDSWTSQHSVLFAVSVVSVSVVMSMVLRWAYKAMVNRVVPVYVWATGLVLLSVLASILVGQLHYYFWLLLINIWPSLSALITSQPIASISLLLVPIFLAWSCLYWLVTRQAALTKANQDNELLNLRIKEKQLAMLLSQLNPHFMFNTINNIRSLVRIDSDRAREMLSAFADILRYQFATESTAETSVEKELEFVEAYVALHKLQLGQRLNFVMTIDDNYLNCSIPKMAIQLLVENAIKHAYGAQGVVGDLTLVIGADENDSHCWHVTLSHPGKIIKTENAGIGLSNLRSRISMFYENADLLLSCHDDHVIAKLNIHT